MEDELMHYGIKGMKWGVRRTPEQLGRKADKLDRKNQKLSKKMSPRDTIKADRYEAKAKRYEAKADKFTVKSNKYNKKYEKYDRKAQRDEDRGSLSKWNRDMANDYKMRTIANAMSAGSFRNASQVMQMKANAIRSNQEATKAAIQKNKRLSDMYRSTASALDSGTIEQGRLFMRYVYNYEE